MTLTKTAATFSKFFFKNFFSEKMYEIKKDTVYRDQPIFFQVGFNKM